MRLSNGSEVFLVSHTLELSDGEEELKIIGIYASRADANLAVERMSSQPGFSDHLDGFSISEYELGKDHWVGGFDFVIPE
jgi:hypothetical protein